MVAEAADLYGPPRFCFPLPTEDCTWRRTYRASNAERLADMDPVSMCCVTYDCRCDPPPKHWPFDNVMPASPFPSHPPHHRVIRFFAVILGTTEQHTGISLTQHGSYDKYSDTRKLRPKSRSESVSVGFSAQMSRWDYATVDGALLIIASEENRWAYKLQARLPDGDEGDGRVLAKK